MIQAQLRFNQPRQSKPRFLQTDYTHAESARCSGSGQEPIKMPIHCQKNLCLMRFTAACLLLFAFVGCVSESQKVVPTVNENGLPVEVLRVPQQMQDLSGELLRYHAKFRALPEALEMLLEEKFISAERYASLPDYLYSPTDKYKLRDGRVVILVDSEVRVEGHAWCIVREPDGQPRSIQLNVTPISLIELEAAARRSR